MDTHSAKPDREYDPLAEYREKSVEQAVYFLENLTDESRLHYIQHQPKGLKWMRGLTGTQVSKQLEPDGGHEAYLAIFDWQETEDLADFHDGEIYLVIGKSVGSGEGNFDSNHGSIIEGYDEGLCSDELVELADEYLED